MLNKYQKNLLNAIKKYKSYDLSQFRGPNRQAPKFDDLVWYYIDPSTKQQTRFLCSKHVGHAEARKQGLRGDNFDKHLALPDKFSEIIKLYIIHIVNRPITKRYMQSLVIGARYILSNHSIELYEHNILTYKKLNRMGCREFFSWCMSNEFMPQFHLEGISYEKGRDRTGHTIVDVRLNKLPKEASILALGAIFNDIFQGISKDGYFKSAATAKSFDLGGAIVVTTALLSLASPNRISAEVFSLHKQKLKAFSDGNDSKVYYLDWGGSKGFGDYRNHILSALAPQVSKAVSFFFQYCEPYRIICRFYEKPETKLKDLIGDFLIKPERLKNLSLNKIPTLFQLGYAIGLYGVDEEVYVFKKELTPSNSIKYRMTEKYFELKPIYSLSHDSYLSSCWQSSFSSLKKLLGQALSRQTCPNQPFSPEEVHHVSHYQKWWIEHMKTFLIPTFPIAFTSSANSVKMSEALICLPNKLVAKKNVSVSGGLSFYAIRTPKANAEKVVRLLTGSTNKSSKIKTIWEDYGFSNELCLKPHSLRHFANTLADMSNIPVEIITAWSGRTNPDQTHTYIHTGEEEKADRVRAILNIPDARKENIKIISAQEIIASTNLPATISSTGICTQELNVTPCSYLNDFASQCFMCGTACHIAGDSDAISLLEKDLQTQVARLEKVNLDPRFFSSNAMREWFKLHTRNTAILSILIELMNEQPEGTVIRFSERRFEFNITDLQTKTLTNYNINLPDLNNEMNVILSKNNNSKTNKNDELSNLLTSFGLDSGVI